MNRETVLPNLERELEPPDQFVIRRKWMLSICCFFVFVFFVILNADCIRENKHTYNVTLNKNATLHNLALFSTTNHTCNVTKNRDVTMHKLLNACEHTM